MEMANKNGAPRAAHTQLNMDAVEAWLIANPGPHTVVGIRKGTGILTPEHHANTALANLRAEGKVQKNIRNMWSASQAVIIAEPPPPPPAGPVFSAVGRVTGCDLPPPDGRRGAVRVSVDGAELYLEVPGDPAAMLGRRVELSIF
jgi:hypothetical protein